jgi:hypothetical protein
MPVLTRSAMRTLWGRDDDQKSSLFRKSTAADALEVTHSYLIC